MLRWTIRLIPERFYTFLPPWGEVAERGHERILQAARSGDPAAARSAAAEHVMEGGELLINHFSDGGYWTPPRG